jgi:hypothetical protein
MEFAVGRPLSHCHTTQSEQKDIHPTIPLLLRVFVAARTSLLSRCLAEKEQKKVEGITHRVMGGIYEHLVE